MFLESCYFVVEPRSISQIGISCAIRISIKVFAAGQKLIPINQVLCTTYISNQNTDIHFSYPRPKKFKIHLISLTSEIFIMIHWIFHVRNCNAAKMILRLSWKCMSQEWLWGRQFAHPDLRPCLHLTPIAPDLNVPPYRWWPHVKGAFNSLFELGTMQPQEPKLGKKKKHSV